MKNSETKGTKGTPKRDGSGGGKGANKGRGGCNPTRSTRRGRNN